MATLVWLEAEASSLKEDFSTDAWPEAENASMCIGIAILWHFTAKSQQDAAAAKILEPRAAEI
jgi:hypothetical protein